MVRITGGKKYLQKAPQHHLHLEVGVPDGKGQLAQEQDIHYRQYKASPKIHVRSLLPYLGGLPLPPPQDGGPEEGQGSPRGYFLRRSCLLTFITLIATFLPFSGKKDTRMVLPTSGPRPNLGLGYVKEGLVAL